MKEVEITRSFTYNGITLPCPGLALSPDQVREFYQPQYPELTTALVEGPVTKGGVQTYSFVRACGTKGLYKAPETLRDKVVALAKSQNVDDKSINADIAPKEMSAMSQALKNALDSTAGGNVRSMPPVAHGIWG